MLKLCVFSNFLSYRFRQKYDVLLFAQNSCWSFIIRDLKILRPTQILYFPVVYTCTFIQNEKKNPLIIMKTIYCMLQTFDCIFSLSKIGQDLLFELMARNIFWKIKKNSIKFYTTVTIFLFIKILQIINT